MFGCLDGSGKAALGGETADLAVLDLGYEGVTVNTAEMA